MSGRYTVEGLFAEGAQSRLYRATDSLYDTVCLLKAGDHAIREAALALQLNHPYISTPFDSGLHPEIGAFAAYPLYLENSYIEWIRTQPGEREMRRVASQLAEFLAYLHHCGWLYQDFKPEHFLIGAHEIKVVDLGLCCRLNDAQNENTFSGTFPYIAPEILSGRPADARSDIFAAGMMLLHGFFPNEDWSFEPEFSRLQQIQLNSRRLKGFWRDVITEMTAFEPTQRIGSASELWNRLRPEQEKGTFLFFPAPSFFAMNEVVEESASAVWLHSSSLLTLEHAEHMVLSNAWLEQKATYHLDLRRTGVERALQMLAMYLTGLGNDSNFYIAVEQLQNQKQDRPVVVVIHASQMDSKEAVLLNFALATLSNVENVRFVVAAPSPPGFSGGENFKSVSLPSIRLEKSADFAAKLFPLTGKPNNRQSALLKKNYQSPEQFMSDLRQQLSEESRAFWPAAARLPSSNLTIDGLRSAEKKLMFLLTLAGGSCPADLLVALLKKTEKECSILIENLRSAGFVQEESGRIRLIAPPSALLARLRPVQVREMSTRILESLRSGDWKELKIVYHAAVHAGQKRKAAAAALHIARNTPESEEKYDWLYKSFRCGAQFPRRLLHRMALYHMRRGYNARTAAILRGIQLCYGRSFPLADLRLDYFLRLHQIERGIRLADQCIRIAASRRQQKVEDYFTVKKAGLLILLHRFDDADALLKAISHSVQSLRTKGMIHQLSGVIWFYRGDYKKALKELRASLSIPHRFRPTALNTIGGCYARMDRYQPARKWLDRAAAVFSRRQDIERLSHVYNNLGVIYRRLRDLPKARLYFYRAANLGKIARNVNAYVSAMNNLATSYEFEGRTRKALSCYSRMIEVTQKHKIDFHRSAALSNIGLQYAITGQYKRAITALREAIAIRKQLGVKVNLAATYENVGLVHFLFGRTEKAVNYFKMSIALFSESSCVADAQRVDLLCVLCLIAQNRLQEASDALDNKRNIPPNSVQLGLWNYAIAYRELSREQWNPRLCRDSLHEAERIFRKFPVLFWLARVHLLKIEYFQRTERFEKALLSLHSAFNLFSRLEARKELLRLDKKRLEMKTPEDILNQITEKLPYKVLVMLKSVLSAKDPESMITAILSNALEFTDMERAVLILQEDPPRIFKSVSIDDSSVQEIFEISRSALESACESGKPFVCYDAPAHPYMKSKPSIIGNHIMSIACLPLKADEKVIGVLYLDSKEGVESLTSTENLLLEIFSSITALSLNRALALERSLDENRYLKDSALWQKMFPEIIGRSSAIQDILKNVHRLADNDLPVLICGETGTGKELIARVVHFSGKRKNAPFLAVNCSGFSKDLMESELFGHEKGAFTGAVGLKKGLFEEAKEGTLFLDEISELPFSMQARLLRVLQDGEFRRVGGTQTLKSRARIVLATNRNLREMVEQKCFREDLYYRIKGVQIDVPPLRHRAEDIPILATEFLKQAVQSSSKQIRGFTPEASRVIKQYHWPGNVRQLKMEIDRLVALADNEWITVEDLDPQIKEVLDYPVETGDADSLQEIERLVILERLEKFNWNVVKSARSLGLTRHGLYSKMRRYHISPPAKA